MMTTFFLISILAGASFSLTLLIIIIRLKRELARARCDAAFERKIACIFQQIAREQQDMAHLWMERAQGGDGLDVYRRAWDNEEERP